MNRKTKELENSVDKGKRRDDVAVIMIAIDFILIIIYLCLNFIPKIGYGVVSTFGSRSQKVIRITQNNINWDVLSDLDIFCNPEFGNKKIIAPRSKSDYTFQITNTLNEPVYYDISFKDVNEYDVNMQYTMKLDNVYIVGRYNEYVNVSEMNVSNIVVAPKSTNNFTIEWFWKDSQNDTEIGKKLYAEYKLYIDVTPHNM